MFSCTVQRVLKGNANHGAQTHNEKINRCPVCEQNKLRTIKNATKAIGKSYHMGPFYTSFSF